MIEHGVMIKGPSLIGKNCEIRKGAYIRENVVMGDGCTIGNSSELKNSILFDRAEISHFNYVGDSIVAKKGHMAAGSITSNLKLNSSLVTVQMGSVRIPTELMKFGAIVGENVQVGCNVVLNPGSILSRDSVVYPGVIFRGVLGERRIVKLIQNQTVVDRL